MDGQNTTRRREPCSKPSGAKALHQKSEGTFRGTRGKTLTLPPQPKPMSDVFLLTQAFLLTGSPAKPCSRKPNYGA